MGGAEIAAVGKHNPNKDRADGKEGAAGKEGKKEKPTVPDQETVCALVSFESILDFVLEGLLAPFRTRVEQVLQSQPSIVAFYKVAQLFAFFADTLGQALESTASNLVQLLEELR